MDEPDYFAKPPPGYVTQSPDTAYWAEKLLFDHWRGLEPERRVEVMCGWSRSMRALALAGLRRRMPDASDQALELELARVRLGDEVWQWVSERRAAEEVQ